jgi:competence protein ComEC
VSRQRGRLFLWLPVAFGFGAAAYLCLPVELNLLWFIAAASLSGGAWLICRHYGSQALSGLALAIFLVFAGGLICKLRAEQVAAPVLPSDRSEYNIAAVVVDVVSGSAEAPRLMLAPVAIRGLPREQMPLRLRVTLRPGMLDAYDIKPGDTISAFAILNPPPSPLIPGGYDFARTAYFQGVGGVGFIPGQPRVLADQDYGWRLGAATGLNRLRWALTRGIVEDIKPAYRDGAELGGFAAALVTGHQAFVPQSLIDEMRDSGLAHILSISGVHMAVVGAFIFFALRWCMAAIPWLALRVPVKKVAAAVSIVTVAVYLAISGTPAPAVRAAVVAWVAFAAILLDRRALSLRALAIAAFIVILLTPEAVIQPGFQMSFCATAALLAMSEAHQPPIREINVPWWVRAFQKTVQGLWVSVLLSLVATLATTPFSIAYFNRFSVYGLVSNLFEAPITTFIVMPGLAVGAVLSETPLGPVALRIAAGGLWLIARVAEWTAGLKGAVVTWPGAPDFVLVLSFTGLIWVCLIRGWARWLGVLAGLAILYWPRLPAPDVWIDPQGGNAAVRVGNEAYLLRPKVRRAGYDYWSRRYGFDMSSDEGRDKDYDCAGYACTPWPDARLRIGFWFSNKPPNRLTLTTLCLNSNLVVLRSPVGDWPEDCSGVNRISAGDFRRLGAMKLTRREGEWRLKAAQPLRGDRPWTRPSVAEDSY